MSRLDEIDDIPETSITEELEAQRQQKKEQKAQRNIPIADTARQAAERQQADYERLQALEAEMVRQRAEGKIEVQLPLSKIRPSPYSNRSEYYFTTDRYREIRNSIEQHGQLIPIKVRPIPQSEGEYEVVYGSSRYRAHLDLRRPTIRAVVEALSDADLLLQMEVENRERTDLSAYEQARFYQQLLEVAFQGNREKLCSKLSRSNPWLSQQLAISQIPPSLFAAFPQLHEAGMSLLLDLARAIRTADDEKRLLAAQDTLKVTNPASLIRRLIHVLQAAPVVAKPSKKRLTDSRGDVILETSPLAKGGYTFRFTKGQEDFAVFMFERADQLYREFKKNSSK